MTAKIGRNDLCPCGSGRKHKKCCGDTKTIVPSVASRISEGYAATAAGQLRAARAAWLVAWDWLEAQLPASVRTLDAATAAIGGSETVAGWFADFQAEMFSAGLSDRTDAKLALRVLSSAQGRFPDEHRLHYDLRTSAAALKFVVGRAEEGESGSRELIAERPERALAYLALANAWTRSSVDRTSAVLALLEQAKAVPVEDGAKFSLDPRIEALRLTVTQANEREVEQNLALEAPRDLLDDAQFHARIGALRARWIASTEPEPSALWYRNRAGKLFYLHEGKTKTGKPRYSMTRSVGPGALLVLPAGFEITESINGVVSVSRLGSRVTDVAARDLERVRKELGRRAPGHEARAQGGEIMIYASQGGRWLPVMKLVQDAAAADYMLHRMTYRGEGGWSWALASGPVSELVEYFDHLGRESFFELM